ncbi:DUF1934 domain-containing protein [Sporosarcina sp. G11-34]|uniref:DUF1934 domain-containing protein n=1 Tax=Sporosarcina sp. G11-34 TaxID=2849605 RepID=UPI0022A8EE80|nr:DUF1934 domain-containing protein [Sporosarcina sp. G11-34]MCZ2257491.1 DUF1934 domain-containing protein [Sporosarcina sp. G11-34]
MESRNVHVLLNSTIRHPGQETETHELKATGQCIVKAGRSYLKYEEDHDGKRIQTMIKMGANDALIMRKGAVDMRLPFNVEEERQGTYGNGPATFGLVVQTERLIFEENENTFSGTFSVMYSLWAEESVLGNYELTITYTEGTS